MTKVKTILAEFCTAKDILAINRLGLIKSEERESQPIPWRHRLPNAERRELVMSEMRSSLRPTSRLTARDKAKAVTTARSPKDSKMGESLLNIHVRGDPHLGSYLGRISRDQRRLEHSLQQTKHSFLRSSRCLNHEPLILVERPPSPNVRSRAMLMKSHGIDPEVAALPNYMRPLQSRSKTPSTLTTIEAFTIDSKKKKNIWEEAVEEAPKFKSTAKPSARLTEHEIAQLRIGHSLHKPTAETISAPRAELPPTERSVYAHVLPAPPSRPKSKGEGAASTQKAKAQAEASGSVFITQLSQKEIESSVEKTTSNNAVAVSKTVTFSHGHTNGRKTSSAGSARAKAGSRPTSRGSNGSGGGVRSGAVGRTAKIAGGGGGGVCVERKEDNEKWCHPTPPAGRERSEKKMKDFLSVLLDEA